MAGVTSKKHKCLEECLEVTFDTTLGFLEASMETLKILYADDDADTRELVSLILRHAGHTVISAENGSQALRMMDANPVNLVLLDVMMPFMDGFETCRRIRQTSDIPLIFLTVLEQERDILTGLKAGANDYIIKPFRSDELVERVQAAARAYQS
jgi:DNA-binding response OmpR family regulator